jgi:hypothetical protein
MAPSHEAPEPPEARGAPRASGRFKINRAALGAALGFVTKARALPTAKMPLSAKRRLMFPLFLPLSRKGLHETHRLDVELGRSLQSLHLGFGHECGAH